MTEKNPPSERLDPWRLLVILVVVLVVLAGQYMFSQTLNSKMNAMATQIKTLQTLTESLMEQNIAAPTVACPCQQKGPSVPPLDAGPSDGADARQAAAKNASPDGTMPQSSDPSATVTQ